MEDFNEAQLKQIREEVKGAVSDAIQEVLLPMMRFFVTKDDLKEFRQNVDDNLAEFRRTVDNNVDFMINTTRRNSDSIRSMITDVKELLSEHRDTPNRLTSIEDRLRLVENRLDDLQGVQN